MTDFSELKKRHEAVDKDPIDGAWNWPPAAHAAHNDRAALIARVEELEGALTFYASELNHIGHADPRAGVYLETSPVDTDGGERARAALKGAAT